MQFTRACSKPATISLDAALKISRRDFYKAFKAIAETAGSRWQLVAPADVLTENVLTDASNVSAWLERRRCIRNNVGPRVYASSGKALV